MGRFKKRFKGVCWKRKSSDSDFEDDSNKKKTDNGERSNVKGKRLPRGFSKGDELKRHVVDLDLHLSKAVNDLLDKLDQLEELNLETIEEFVGMLDVDLKRKVVRLAGECKGEPQGLIQPSKYVDDKVAKQVSVKKDLVKDVPRVCDVQISQSADDNHRVRSVLHPQRNNIEVMIQDRPGEESAKFVAERKVDRDLDDTKAECLSRDIASFTDDTAKSVMSTCSGPDTSFTCEKVSVGVMSTEDRQEGKPNPQLGVTQVKMISVATETKGLVVGSEKFSKHALVDNDVHISGYKPYQTEMKGIAVNTENAPDLDNTGLPLSILFNPKKVWEMTPFDVYCKRISAHEQAPLRDGKSSNKCMFARPASKSRLQKCNLAIPKAFTNVNITQNIKDKPEDQGESATEKVQAHPVQVDLETATPNVFKPEPRSDDMIDELDNHHVGNLTHIPQLRRLCRNMFFHVSNQNESDTDRCKLSGLPMEYIDAAHQRLKGAHSICEGSMMVMPLKEMCRQLLGIAGLGKQGPTVGLSMGSGFHTKAKQYLKNADSHLVVNKQLSAVVTSDENMEFPKYELSAGMSYQLRSGSTRDIIKATHADGLDEKRVIDLVHIPQLKVVCRKMFFGDILHASVLDNSDTDGCELLGLAVAYINDAHQRLNARSHGISEENMVVMPLRDMCRHLLGIGRLAVNGQFGDVTTSAGNMRHQQKSLNHADSNVTKVKQLSRIPKLVSFTIDKVLSTPVGATNLRDLIDRHGTSGTFKEIHVQFLSYNLLEGLKFLHRKGITHGLISPRRIVFNSNGYPSLMSGIKEAGQKIQPRIEFSSPEMITSGSITMATDIFQVGVLAYSFMYGRSPYKAANYSQTKMNLLDENFTPQFKSGSMSRDGRYFIRKCIRKKPELRFNFVKCKRPLEYVVNWFYVFKGEDLANQMYVSPFKDLLQKSA